MTNKWQPTQAINMAVGIVTVSTIIGLSSITYAKNEISLFDSSGEQIDGYEQVLNQLREGDQLCFGRNCSFRFEISGMKWSGRTTQVLEAQRVFADGKRSVTLALRVPLKSGKTSYATFRHETPYVEYISGFVNGHRQLSALGGVDLPRIYWSFKNQFAAVEFIDFDFSLSDFFLNRDQFSAKQLAQAESALYRFVENTVHIKSIGDFHSNQIVFDRERQRWVLLDFFDKGNHFMPLFSRAGLDGQHPLGWENSLDVRGEIKKLSESINRSEGLRIFATIDGLIQSRTSRPHQRFFNLCSRMLLRQEK